MRNRPILILSLSVLSLVGALSVAQAKENNTVCDTLEECKSLKEEVESRIALLTKNSVLDLDFGSYSNKWMYYIQAEKYCQARGSRLPSVRELAHFASQHGAEGITTKSWAKFIQTHDLPNLKDSFFYSFSGYKKFTSSELGIWSSSRDAETLNHYRMDLNDGIILSTDIVYGSVICVEQTR